ncbi:O-acetyl transferase [Bacillus sp. JCM 19047]|nr:O-acetyl transferase [Bacillus sp. JCM 19047]
MQSTERIDWIDALKGFTIMLVVWGHLNTPYIPEAIIYSFHMPLFFVISGYLNKNRNNSLGKTVKSKGKALLIPYLIFATLSVPVGVAMNYVSGEGISASTIVLNFLFLNGNVGWNSPIWFLVVLFLVEVAFWFYNRSNTKGLIFISVFVLGFLAALTAIRYPFGLQIVLWGLVFFIVGNWLKNKEIIKLLSLNTERYLLSTLAFVGVGLTFGVVLNGRISLYHNEVFNYAFFMVSAIAGSIALILIFSKIGNSKILNFYGKNTLLILATHYFFLLGYQTVDKFIFDLTYLSEPSLLISGSLAIVTIIIYYPLSLFVNKYMPFLLGDFSTLRINKFKSNSVQS